VACTYDGMNKKVYVDGVEVATKAYSQTLRTNPAGTAIIGAYGSGVAYFFNGKIDEVKISNVARSASEIAKNYTAGINNVIKNITLPATDFSTKSFVPFYVAADRPGTYLQATMGESAFANYQPDSNTGGLWHLDEKSGFSNYLEDNTQNRNHGTPTGTTFVEGKLGKARNFNGTSDFIDAGGSNSIPESGDITLEAWFRTTDAGNTRMLLSKGNTSDWTYAFSKNTNNKIYCKFYQTNSGTGYIETEASPVVNDGKWHYTACVLSGTTLSIYVDGQLSVSTSTTAGTRDTDTAGNLYIGKFNWSTTYNWLGDIDEVRISNTARSAADIRQAYEIGLRTHIITIDFAATGNVYNTITSSADTSFGIDATAYGLKAKGSNLFKGDKIIVRENYDGVEYIAQATVTNINTMEGIVNVQSWDSGSTFPAGGFTENADFFKWQKEYWPVANTTLSTFLDQITNITLRQTNGEEGRTIWLDDFKTSGNYLTTPAGSTITSPVGRQFLQYRSILTSTDPFVSASLSSVSFASDVGPTPYLTPTPLPTFNGEATGASSCYLEESAHDDQITLHWTDGSSSEIGYEIEKQINGGEWQSVDITSPNTSSYSDENVSAGNQYRYRIRVKLGDGVDGQWCGTSVVDLKTGNAQFEGIKMQGVKID